MGSPMGRRMGRRLSVAGGRSLIRLAMAGDRDLRPKRGAPSRSKRQRCQRKTLQPRTASGIPCERRQRQQQPRRERTPRSQGRRHARKRAPDSGLLARAKRQKKRPAPFRGNGPEPSGINSLKPTSWWRRWGSNPRPQHCERCALPTELRPHEGVSRRQGVEKTTRPSSQRALARQLFICLKITLVFDNFHP